MNIIYQGSDKIAISLSRRNLETLLKCLDNGVPVAALVRQVSDDGTVLTVKAEENEEHYASGQRNEAARGRMGIGPDDVPSAPRVEAPADEPEERKD